jgi:hypothetical protein
MKIHTLPRRWLAAILSIPLAFAVTPAPFSDVAAAQIIAAWSSARPATAGKPPPRHGSEASTRSSTAAQASASHARPRD